MYQVEYTALKYYNSAISEECLYLGMLYNNLTTGKRDFKYISNFSRFQSFDDEADVGFVKLYLKGIKQQVENNIFNYQSFNIKDFTKIFVNEFRFTDVMSIKVEENDDYVNDMTKLYLKFDFAKKNRLSEKIEKQYIKKILSSTNIKLSPPEIIGGYNEEIKFDYIIDNIGIKIFTFKDKNLKKIIPTAKQWSFTAGEMRDNLKIVFMYDNLTDDNIHLDIILNILKKNASVFQVQDGLDYVLKQIS